MNVWWRCLKKKTMQNKDNNESYYLKNNYCEKKRIIINILTSQNKMIKTMSCYNLIQCVETSDGDAFNTKVSFNFAVSADELWAQRIPNLTESTFQLRNKIWYMVKRYNISADHVTHVYYWIQIRRVFRLLHALIIFSFREGIDQDRLKRLSFVSKKSRPTALQIRWMGSRPSSQFFRSIIIKNLEVCAIYNRGVCQDHDITW